MWLAAGGLKIQSVSSLRSLSWIWSWSISSMAWLSSLRAPTKSHCRTWSRWAIILRRSAWIKESVLSEHAAVSMCTALLTRQVKRDSYLFMSSRLRRKPALRVRRDIGERLGAPPSRLETCFARITKERIKGKLLRIKRARISRRAHMIVMRMSHTMLWFFPRSPTSSLVSDQALIGCCQQWVSPWGRWLSRYIPALPYPHGTQLRKDRWKNVQADVAVVRSENGPINRWFLATPIKEYVGSNRDGICAQWTGRNEFRGSIEVARYSPDLRRLESVKSERLDSESSTFSFLLRGQTTNRVIRPNRL